jgi:hypothetical protein
MVKNKILLLSLSAILLLGILGICAGCSSATQDFTVTSSTDVNHSHDVTIIGRDVDNPSDKTYTTTSTGAVPHTHTVTLTRAQFEEIKQGNSVTVTSSAFPANNHTHTFTIKK